MDRPILQHQQVTIGRFICPTGYSSFRDTGPIERYLIVFPRSAVWIQHEGSRRFLADPTIVTIYNRGQRYQRFPASPDGDRCDWFGVAAHLAREIAVEFDPQATDHDRPFRYEWGPSSAALFLRQRTLWERALHGQVDALEAEEEVIRLIAAVLKVASARRPESRARRQQAVARHRELAEAAREELFRTLGANRSVVDLAASLDTSPYHLCRVFHECTGRTMHEYRTEVRLRVALEGLSGPISETGTLSRLAVELGFCSHSHFVRTMRRIVGATPSDVRARVGGSARPR